MQAFQDYASAEEQGGFWYGYHYDAHTSLVGVRQVAQLGATCLRSDSEVEDWLQGKINPDNTAFSQLKSSKFGLFAYPAQSNLNGHRPPLRWSGQIRSSPHRIHQNIYTLLDAAAYVTTAQLDLSDPDTSPDFTALSFYKIFGFPDMGALIVRKAASHILRHRKYFGGGTVEMVIALDAAWHAKKTKSLHDELEDGTLPFHSIIALDSAFDVHERLFGSMARVSSHACYLSRVLYSELSSMMHSNGLPVCEIYKHPDSTYGNSKTQGPTIAFNVRNSQGGWVGKSDVEKMAIVCGIQLRTGGVCNPGGIATYLDLRSWELRRNFAEGMRCGDDSDILAGKPTGVVRVSLGAMSSMRDVETFVRFIREVFMESVPKKDCFLAPRRESVASFKVKSVTIFPINGCQGWLVPPSLPWEIKQDGLALDGEWCVYDTLKQEPLVANRHPRLQVLRPSIDVVKGVLRIAIIPSANETNNIEQEIAVSYWEKPPNNTARGKSATTSAPDIYGSRALAEFFTSFMGFPCTLARYPYNRVSDFQHKTPRNRSRKSIPGQKIPRKPYNNLAISTLPAENSLKISVSATGSINGNISIVPIDSSLPSDTAQQPWAYVRIGPHYFQNLEPLSTSNIRHVRYLPNHLDLSPKSQYPTIHVGQTIEIFSFVSAAEDVALRACFASLSRGEFICPVSACRKDFQMREELDRHFWAHREILKTALAGGKENDPDYTGYLQSLKFLLKHQWNKCRLGARIGIDLDKSGTGVSGKNRLRWWRKFGFRFGDRVGGIRLQ